MTVLDIHAAGWRERADFFAALLPGLGTPDWAGGNLDALFDCLVAGHMLLAPPFAVRVFDAAGLPRDLLDYLGRAVQVFDDARAQYGVPVWLHLG